jgi:4-carboxymuconolactone decarboxylase
MAAETDFLARGREVAGKLWGARAGGQELPAQKVAPEFFGLVTQFVFGMFWSRPNLDLRSRSLCTVAQLAALGRTDELKGHLMGALNIGIRREELIEVLMQTACYAGVPAAVNALNAAADVLKERPAGG